MICPACNTPVPEGAQFCPECGARLTPDEPEPQSFQTPLVPGQGEANDTPKKRRPRHLALIILGIAFLCALCGGAWCALHSLGPVVKAQTAHPVVFVLTVDEGEELDDHSSRIPVRITGTTADGQDFDETLFLARDGVDCTLEAGKYHAEILASPIASDGAIYDLVVGEVDFTIPKSLPAGETFVLPQSRPIVLTPADPATLTDETIAECVEWAKKDDDPNTDAAALEKAAKAWREEGERLGPKRRVHLDTESTPMF